MLAHAKNVTPTDELLIEKNDDLIVGAPNNSTAQAKRNVVALLAVEVHYSGTHLEAIGVLVAEGW